jgi:hypothetical protein
MSINRPAMFWRGTLSSYGNSDAFIANCCVLGESLGVKRTTARKLIFVTSDRKNLADFGCTSGHRPVAVVCSKEPNRLNIKIWFITNYSHRVFGFDVGSAFTLYLGLTNRFLFVVLSRVPVRLDYAKAGRFAESNKLRKPNPSQSRA